MIVLYRMLLDFAIENCFESLKKEVIVHRCIINYMYSHLYGTVKVLHLAVLSIWCFWRKVASAKLRMSLPVIIGTFLYKLMSTYLKPISANTFTVIHFFLNSVFILHWSTHNNVEIWLHFSTEFRKLLTIKRSIKLCSTTNKVDGLAKICTR